MGKQIGRVVADRGAVIVRLIFNRLRLEYMIYKHTRDIVKKFRSIKKPIIYDLFRSRSYDPRFTKKDYAELLIRAEYLRKRWNTIKENKDLDDKTKGELYDKLIDNGFKKSIKYLRDD